MPDKYVYLFSEGNAQMKNLLGGKGANLAEMTGLGLPVPPGFTITTDACTQAVAGETIPHPPQEKSLLLRARLFVVVNHAAQTLDRLA